MIADCLKQKDIVNKDNPTLQQKGDRSRFWSIDLKAWKGEKRLTVIDKSNWSQSRKHIPV